MTPPGQFFVSANDYADLLRRDLVALSASRAQSLTTRSTQRLRRWIICEWTTSLRPTSRRSVHSAGSSSGAEMLGAGPCLSLLDGGCHVCVPCRGEESAGQEMSGRYNCVPPRCHRNSAKHAVRVAAAALVTAASGGYKKSRGHEAPSSFSRRPRAFWLRQRVGLGSISG
jgi:hypothetical protein